MSWRVGPLLRRLMWRLEEIQTALTYAFSTPFISADELKCFISTTTNAATISVLVFVLIDSRACDPSTQFVWTVFALGMSTPWLLVAPVIHPHPQHLALRSQSKAYELAISFYDTCSLSSAVCLIAEPRHAHSSFRSLSLILLAHEDSVWCQFGGE